MSIDLPRHIVEFLEQPNPAVMAVVRRGAEPVSVPTWYLLSEGQILLNMLRRRERMKYITPDSFVSLTVMADGDWYRHVSLRGRVRDIAPDVDYRHADLLSRHYTGVDHEPRGEERVSLWVEVERWHAWRIDPA